MANSENGSSFNDVIRDLLRGSPVYRVLGAIVVVALAFTPIILPLITNLPDDINPNQPSPSQPNPSIDEIQSPDNGNNSSLNVIENHPEIENNIQDPPSNSLQITDINENDYNSFTPTPD